jgi:hypothetical protein
LAADQEIGQPSSRAFYLSPVRVGFKASRHANGPVLAAIEGREITGVLPAIEPQVEALTDAFVAWWLTPFVGAHEGIPWRPLAALCEPSTRVITRRCA